MSSQATAAYGGWRAWIRKVTSVVDRIGLGLIYVFVIAVLPVSTLGFFNRTV